MTSPLSWQPLMPAPVTSCLVCPYFNEANEYFREGCGEAEGDDDRINNQIYHQNKNGITESCPMWQQQNKEVK